MSSDVIEELTFYSTDDTFYLEPLNSKEILKIDRLNYDITLENKITLENAGKFSVVGASRKNVYGIIGIVNLIAGPYLILITGRSKVGILNKQQIWKLQNFEFIPYAKNLNFLTNEQKIYNEKYLNLTKDILNTPSFYFSYTYDLTHSLQRLYYTAEDFLSMPLFERGDCRFIWNQHLVRDLLLEPRFSRFCLPLLHGFISIKHAHQNGEWFNWAVISRRSVYRAGTRLWVRGADTDGYCANYVETEQLIEYRDFTASFIQTRGSIPLQWTQSPNLKYKPRPRLLDNHESGFTRHFERQVLSYGKQVAVNLIDQKGPEGSLHEGYKGLIDSTNSQMIRDNVRYEYFDFHHECRKMRWDRLSILLSRIKPDLDNMGFFLLRSGVVLLEQEGVFRTNCIDCLDRTNVVQSMIAREQLASALQRMGILKPGGQGVQAKFEPTFVPSDPKKNPSDPQLEKGGEFEPTESYFDPSDDKKNLLDPKTQKQWGQFDSAGTKSEAPQSFFDPTFESLFKNIWADNADHLSIQYSGTGALKTDFTRTGKRTHFGLLRDGLNSAIRYIKNNFTDGDRQDGMDIFLGKYEVDRSEGSHSPCPLQDTRDPRLMLLPAAMFFCLLMVFACLLLSSEYSSYTLLSLLFWTFMMTLATYSTFAQGYNFVNAPKLSMTSSLITPPKVQ